ncbi:hypothetical protein MKX03_017139 [Papaver bracteatum]|nr:hypothetical protein MKX03_017139 [Papaver bracteatum]
MSTHEISSRELEYDDDEYAEMRLGLTRLKKMKKKFKGKKHVIEFDKVGRFKGEYKYEIASYMGVLVHRDVGLKYLKWKEVKSVLRDKLWHELLIKEKEIREDGDPSRSLLWRKAHQNKMENTMTMMSGKRQHNL